MRLLDLFCCEGGAGMGYHRAGFEVVGVDIDKRGHRYPFEFHQADALEYLAEHGHEFDAIHASPPCQAYSIATHESARSNHPDLLAPTRDALEAAGLPYIIENVPGAPMRNPLTLCGASFGLTAIDTDGTKLVLRRHRLFESNVWLTPIECDCLIYKDRGYLVGGVYGGGRNDKWQAKHVRHGGYTPSSDVQAALLDIDWMTVTNLSQAIPPAYTQYLGEQLMAHLTSVAVMTRPDPGGGGEPTRGDEWAICPGCSRDVLVSELCECDAEDGPKCLARCCETDHPVGTWRGSAA